MRLLLGRGLQMQSAWAQARPGHGSVWWWPPPWGCVPRGPHPLTPSPPSTPRRTLAPPRGLQGALWKGPLHRLLHKLRAQWEGGEGCFRQTPSFSSAVAPAAGLVVVAASASTSSTSPCLKAGEATRAPPAGKQPSGSLGSPCPFCWAPRPPNGDSSVPSGLRKV